MRGPTRRRPRFAPAPAAVIRHHAPHLRRVAIPRSCTPAPCERPRDPREMQLFVAVAHAEVQGSASRPRRKQPRAGCRYAARRAAGVCCSAVSLRRCSRQSRATTVPMLVVGARRVSIVAARLIDRTDEPREKDGRCIRGSWWARTEPIVAHRSRSRCQLAAAFSADCSLGATTARMIARRGQDRSRREQTARCARCRDPTGRRPARC